MSHQQVIISHSEGLKWLVELFHNLKVDMEFNRFGVLEAEIEGVATPPGFDNDAEDLPVLEEDVKAVENDIDI